jgi:hypothetical protein
MKRRDILAGLVGVAVALGIGAAAPKGDATAIRGKEIVLRDGKGLIRLGFDRGQPFLVMDSGGKRSCMLIVDEKTVSLCSLTAGKPVGFYLSSGMSKESRPGRWMGLRFVDQDGGTRMAIGAGENIPAVGGFELWNADGEVRWQSP